MLCFGVISLVKNSPTYIKQLIEYIKTRREEKILEEQEESDDSTEGKWIISLCMGGREFISLLATNARNIMPMIV